MTTIKNIENLLGITLEEERLGNDSDPKQKNTYYGKEGHVDSLRLDDIDIDNLTALFAITGELRHLTIVNSSIPNFSDLLEFVPYYLTLDGVTIKGNDCNTLGKLPGHLKLHNMQLDAKSLNCFAKSKFGGFRQVEFHNCHLDNIQYIRTIPQISYLILDTITFTYEPLEVVTRSGLYRMSVYNSTFDQVSFLPYKKELSYIEFGNCNIGSFAGLEEFPELEGITISSDTQVKDKTILPNKNRRNINCNVLRVKKPFDMEQVLPLKKYITRLYLDNFRGDELPHLKKFKRIRHLEFSGGKVNLQAFLPLASQIKSINFNGANFFNHACLAQFKNITSFHLRNFSRGEKALQSFERIVALKHQLKELEIYDVQKIKDAHLLEDFIALESLNLNEIPTKDVQHVFQLKHLKKLQLCVDYKKDMVLNLEQLPNLEYLILDTDMRFKGLEQLHKLKSLQLGSDRETKIDINSLPRIESLERLNITNYSQEINHLHQFKNLKCLRIKGCNSLKLKTMKKLEVLDLDNSSINDFDNFETQPRLKKLNLSASNGDIVLKGISKFPNLEVLDLMETNIKDISDLEPLKKLEYLDLYYTSISDVTVINTLPNMKEVNLATYSKENLENQLDRPEIAVYVGRPQLYLRVWEEDEFGI